ncbi:ankyrin repeat domain-containing protein [Cupriavidus necator]|uniref:ankyrin repeat domain-containing protein n=1 Tax=Cupriavidus necator TaxID=106590 RepID=UPI0006924E61
MGKTAAIKSFLTDGMDPNLRSGPDGMTALMVAAAFGEAEAVRALIAGGADVYAQMGADWTALKWAAYGGARRDGEGLDCLRGRC